MKPISDFLQQLIDEANESLVTSKEKILYVYNQALAEDYTPKEARKLVEEKIINVSKRYLTEVLPIEAKREYTPRENTKSNSELVPKQNEIRHINIEPEPEESRKIFADLEKPDIIEEEEEQEPLAPYTNTDDILKLQNELELHKQLLHEARQKVEELDGLTTEQAYKMQELSRRLTEETTSRVMEPAAGNGLASQEIEKPPSNQHWTQLIEAECQFCQKVTPWILRHFITGKVVKWVDRDRFKELYGTVPAE